MYEGCVGWGEGILSDERMCALSVNQHAQSMHKKGGFLNLHSRNRDGDHCCSQGQGNPMYGFQIRVTGRTLRVWEKAGTELFGVTGSEIAHTRKTWWQKDELFCKVMQANWRIEFVNDQVLSGSLL